MKIIGITGGTGSGKTTALRVVQRLGGCVIDCDALYHEMLKTDEKLLSAIDAAFPGVVQDGALNRKKLGSIVFSDATLLEKLSAVTDPIVHARVLSILETEQQNGRTLAAVDAIRLHESGLGKLCCATVAVTAPVEVRVARLIAREGITEDYARSRIAAQKSDDEFRALCDYVLENDAEEAAFSQRCEALLSKILEEDNTMSEGKFKAEREALLYEPKHGYESLTAEQAAEMQEYCKAYMQFIDAGKTERECVDECIRQAEAAGFVAWEPGKTYAPGDKIYANNRGKAAIFAVVGSQPASEGVNITAAHIDSPRLDLKPNPLYEEAELALFKTHYYGGVKKYQWTVTPLAIHGVVTRRDGETVKVVIGEDDNDPIFCVTDLLIHLSGDQMKKSLADGISGEQLNVLLGSTPLEGDEGGERIKFHILKLLNEKYGIVEQDFYSAELTIVPALKAREVGLDRSMIGAYGHDDRVCAYAEFYPMLSLDTPDKTAVCILADKEEVGSSGVTGMTSRYFEYFMETICGGSARNCFANSKCLSADVCNAFDPTFPEVSDRRNNAFFNRGVGLFKYTGSRGKSGSSDATSELVGYFTRLFDQNGVQWQMGELGRVDQGGGGTVAAFMANRNIDTLDAGVPVLCMHAPYEIVAKYDCYMTMLAMKVFYNA